MTRTGERVTHPREQGLSLVELLVSMLLLGILAAVVSGLYASATRTVTYAQALSSNTRSVSNGMNEISRLIRAATENPVSGATLKAPALELASSEAVTFYASVNLGARAETQPPQKIRLSLDATRRLVETTFAAVPLGAGYFGFSSSPTASRVLTDVIAPASTPGLFTYVKADGTTVVPGGGGLTEAERRLITAVKVSVTVTSGSTDSRSWVTLQNTVGMPNVGLSLAGL